MKQKFITYHCDDVRYAVNRIEDLIKEGTYVKSYQIIADYSRGSGSLSYIVTAIVEE